jgi:tetratricopeptide (TPR) repeat protein
MITKINYIGHSATHKPACFSLILIIFLSLYNLLDKPSYAMGQTVIEDKKTETSEDSWLRQQIQHFRSYPRLDRAYRLVKSEQLIEAAKEFKQYLKFKPHDIDAQLSYITVIYQLKKFQSVISATNQILKQQPDHYEALKYQAYAYQQLNHFEAVSELMHKIRAHPEATQKDKQFIFNALIDLSLTQQNPHQALKLLKKYLTRYPQDLDAQLRYITILYQQKNYESVLDATNLTLKQQPDHYEALKYQTYAYQNLKRFNEAIVNIKKIKTHSKATDVDRKFALNTLIDLFLVQKNDALALKQLEQYLIAYPNDIEAHLRYIIVLNQTNKYQSVIEASNKLLQKKPSHYRALKYQAYAYQYLKQSNEFIRVLDIVSNHPQAKPEERQFYDSMRIEYFMAQKKYKQALVAHQTLSKPSKPSKDFKYYDRLGGIYSALKQNNKAILAYHNALQQTTKKQQKFNILMKLGFLEKQQKHWQKAEKHFALAAQLQQNNLAVMREVAQVAYRQKKYNIAIEWFHKTLTRKDNVIDRELLANALYQEKQYVQAAKEYEKLLSNSQDKPKKHHLAMKLGFAYFYMDKIIQAKSKFLKAINFAHKNTQKYNAHMALGYLEKLSQNWEHANINYQIAHSLKPNNTVSMWAIADIAQKQKYYEQAINWFSRILSIEPSVKVKKHLAYAHQEFGFSLYQQKKWALALKQFQQASEMQQNNARIFLYTAFSYKQLGQYSEAEVYINKAMSNTKQLTNSELSVLYSELGLLYIEEGQYNKAITELKTSLNYQDDIEVRLNIANLYRLTGEFSQAQKMLESINETDLKPMLQRNYFNQTSLVYAEQKQYSLAVEMLLKAENLQPTAEQQYQLGLYYNKLEKREKAIEYLKQANAKNPNNNQYAAALGYIYMAEARYNETIQLFQNIIEQNPNFPNIDQNLGYAQIRNMNNKAAVYHFKQSIDKLSKSSNLDIIPKETLQKIENLKREVSKLTNHYQFSFYQMLRSNNENQNSVVSPSLGSSGVPSQGGINITYQPHQIGYRDGQILQLFARMLWNTPSQTIQLNNDSLQGGIGLRYKPFREYGLFVGVEKLLKVGDNSVDDWLARAQYSWNKTFKENEDSLNHYYLSIYGDLTFFSNETLDRNFSWEANLGKKIQLNSNLFVSPHIVVNGIHQELNTDNDSYTEAGVGVSIQGFFGGNQYHSDTSSAELRLQYKNNFKVDTADWVITGVINY